MYLYARTSIRRHYNSNIFCIDFHCSLIKGSPVPLKKSFRFEVRIPKALFQYLSRSIWCSLLTKPLWCTCHCVLKTLFWNIFPCLDVIIIMIKHGGSAQFDLGQLEVFVLHHLMKCTGSHQVSPFTLSCPFHPSSLHTPSSVSFLSKCLLSLPTVDEQIMKLRKWASEFWHSTVL